MEAEASAGVLSVFFLYYFHYILIAVKHIRIITYSYLGTKTRIFRAQSTSTHLNILLNSVFSPFLVVRHSMLGITRQESLT